ncbi:helix-turn-helix transcriptional regulator [Planotetraspora sp. A-T 1434]|uniref:helix-turn-helix domain-containing protein n=1 Tax=Planotetraspora sp. A-T 1434 TaxID=2979219 RepID=UPI0021BFAB87|nr:helix-turn-helix transcriptional regulator [Planotetraspora sp. A-T 1434]MCT9932399.1 helix-turn-helix transcriptional regulator [Planotetraspora sp. A-T 1434]
MTATSSTDRLTEASRRALDARMHDLRLLYKDVAEKAGMSVAHLRRILNGDQPISPAKAAGLEDALKLQRGAIAALLAGEPLAIVGDARDQGHGKSLAQLLVERGLAKPDEVTLVDEVIDPGIWEILDMGELSEAAKDNFLRAYMLMRRSIFDFDALRAETKKPRG